MRFDQTAIGQRVILIEKMGDAKGDIEIRHTHYERADGEARYYPDRNLSAFRLRLTQGAAGEPARYDTGEVRVLSEVPKSLPVENWTCTDNEDRASCLP